MKAAREHRSGKGHKDENFPVASFVIEARHRGLILAFYEFVRIADDIADHATLSADEKLAQLDRLEAELLGSGDGQPEALRAARRAGRARNVRAASLRRADRVPDGRDEAPLRGLERAHSLLHATRRCRSAASCSTCTARASPPGLRRMRCAPRCRSSTTSRIAAKTTATSTASISRRMRCRLRA